MEQISKFFRKVICVLLMCYQYVLSPFLKPSCRFYPSCSQYALTAVKECGVFKGIWLTTCRLLRCHPWSDGGYDPVSSTSIREKS